MWKVSHYGQIYIDVQMQKFYVKKIITIVPGQYDIHSLLNLIESEIREVGYGLAWTNVRYSQERNRVSISDTHRLSILASLKSNSLLRLLGFNKDIKLNRDFPMEDTPMEARDVRDEVDYIMLGVTKPVEADQSPLRRTHLQHICIHGLHRICVGGKQPSTAAWLLACTKHLGKSGLLELQPHLLCASKRTKYTNYLY